jgi:hypothetical protein
MIISNLDYTEVPTQTNSLQGGQAVHTSTVYESSEVGPGYYKYQRRYYEYYEYRSEYSSG